MHNISIVPAVTVVRIVRRGACLTICLVVLCICFIAGFLALGGSKRGVTYRPLIAPLTISIDGQGHPSITASSPELITPIGTFSVYENVAFPEKRTLTLVLGDLKHVYDLGTQRFEVRIPNDTRGLSKIMYEASGDIIVVVPDPVWHLPEHAKPSTKTD